MIYLYSFLLAVIGFYLFATKLASSGAAVVLYIDRKRTCPKDFLLDQRRSDLLQAVNCLLLSLNGAVVMLSGALSFKPGPWPFAPSFLLVIALSNIVHAVLNKAVLHLSGLRQRMDDLKEGWKRQKRFTAIHDDEVRLYRMIKEAVETERFNAFFSVLLTVIYLVTVF